MFFVFEARHGSRVAANIVLHSWSIVRQFFDLVLLFAGVQLHDIFWQVRNILQVSVSLYLRLQLSKFLLLRMHLFLDMREELLNIKVFHPNCLRKVLADVIALKLVSLSGLVQLLFRGLVEFEYLHLQLVLLLIQDYQIVSDFFGRASVYLFNAIGMLRARCLFILDDVIVQLLVEGFLGLVFGLGLRWFLVGLGLRCWRFFGVCGVLLSVFLGKWFGLAVFFLFGLDDLPQRRRQIDLSFYSLLLQQQASIIQLVPLDALPDTRQQWLVFFFASPMLGLRLPITTLIILLISQHIPRPILIPLPLITLLCSQATHLFQPSIIVNKYNALSLQQSRGSFLSVELDEDRRHVIHSILGICIIFAEQLIEQVLDDGLEWLLLFQLLFDVGYHFGVAFDLPDAVATHDDEIKVFVLELYDVGVGRDDLLLR